MFKAIKENSQPIIASQYSAGADIISTEDVIFKPGEMKIVKCGVKLEPTADMMKQYFVGLFIRSSLAKKGLMLMNGVGVIDMDYPDEIGVMLFMPIGDVGFYENRLYGIDGCSEIFIKSGYRIGQLIVIPQATNIYCDNVSDDNRVGGFGSTNSITIGSTEGKFKKDDKNIEYFKNKSIKK